MSLQAFSSKSERYLICFGSRPEILKLMPVYKEMVHRGADVKILLVGQHTNLIPKDTPHDWFCPVEEDAHNGNRLDSIISSILWDEHAAAAFDWADSVIVQGDTATTFGCALAAFHRQKRIIHVESGLRTGNKNAPYPEEIYRQMVSRMADINFCPTNRARSNLNMETLSTDSRTFVVGNSSLDNLVGCKVTESDLVVVTLHRRENQFEMSQWFQSLENCAKKFPHLNFVLFCHPNPEITKHLGIFESVVVQPALDHSQFVYSLARCKFAITDSGGLQEELAFLGKRAIVCRESTERQEGIASGHLHLCKMPSALGEMVTYVDHLTSTNTPLSPCPFGDGAASQKICDSLGI